MATANRSSRNTNITRIVKSLLALSGRKQNDLAAAFDLSASGMSRKLSAGEWTVDDVDTLAQFFEVPLSTFFRDPEALYRPTDQQEGLSICNDDTDQLVGSPQECDGQLGIPTIERRRVGSRHPRGAILRRRASDHAFAS